MLKIRPFEWKDVDSLNQIINDPEVAKYTQEVTPLPLENMVHQFSSGIRMWYWSLRKVVMLLDTWL